MKYLIANWKANKNIQAANEWLDIFLKNDLSFIRGQVEVIVCPPYPLLAIVRERLKRLSFFKIGAQDVSFFPGGPYTGEVSAATLAGLVDYVIIGHSERRQYFAETSRLLFQKCRQALDQQIEPIFCVRDAADVIAPQVRFVAYEPIEAIGTGQNESLAKVLAMKKQLHLPHEAKFIYGGSVTDVNLTSYLTSPAIDGLLIGAASLHSESFFALIKKSVLV